MMDSQFSSPGRFQCNVNSKVPDAWRCFLPEQGVSKLIGQINPPGKQSEMPRGRSLDGLIKNVQLRFTYCGKRRGSRHIRLISFSKLGPYWGLQSIYNVLLLTAMKGVDHLTVSIRTSLTNLGP